MSPAGEDARDRADATRVRAGELGERLSRLRAGVPVTEDDAARAAQAADEQRARSAVAHRHAAEAHGEAADHHRRASEVLDAGGRPAQAAEHRRKAVADDVAAVEATTSAEADERG